MCPVIDCYEVELTPSGSGVCTPAHQGRAACEGSIGSLSQCGLERMAPGGLRMRSADRRTLLIGGCGGRLRDDRVPAHRSVGFSHSPRARHCILVRDRYKLGTLRRVEFLIRTGPLPNESSKSLHLSPQARTVRLLDLTGVPGSHPRDFRELGQTSLRQPHPDALRVELFCEQTRSIAEPGEERVNRGIQ